MATTRDYGLGEFTFPRGWFMIAASDEVKDKPLSVRFFGQDMVLYRGKATGKLVLLDAYCPHMGTHLGLNATSYVVKDNKHIDGDGIRCPYHNWRFNAEGKCDDIPYYHGAIPKAACVRTWTVVERIGAIFVWHDPENGVPEWEEPSLPEWTDPAWVRWEIDQLGCLNVHPQELLDNIADAQHFDPIHGSSVQYFENEFRGHLAIQRQGGGHRTLVDGSQMLHNDTAYNGPGFLISRMQGRHPSIILIAHTPVDDGTVKAWHALLVKSDHRIATPEDVVMAREYQRASLAAFAQDFEVWTHKKAATRILQVPTDGPFHLARTWYKQFYNPRERKQTYLKQVEGVHRVRGLQSAPARATG